MDRVSINNSRVYILSAVFKSLGIEKILVFEDIDPQFIAIKNLAKECGRYTEILVMLNALVSYRLVMSGEEYWGKFSSYFVDKCVGDIPNLVHLFRDFIEKFNRVLENQKLSRIMRIVRCRELLEIVYRGSLVDIWRAIGRCLNVDLNTKTVVFAIKMLYYARKALGENIEIPMDIPIPVDGRIALITYYSGALEVSLPRISRDILMKYSNTIRFIWSTIARYSGIPPLNLDSILWFFGKYSDLPSRSKILEKAVEDLKNVLSREDIEILVNNLFYRLPKN